MRSVERKRKQPSSRQKKQALDTAETLIETQHIKDQVTRTDKCDDGLVLLKQQNDQEMVPTQIFLQAYQHTQCFFLYVCTSPVLKQLFSTAITKV